MWKIAAFALLVTCVLASKRAHERPEVYGGVEEKAGRGCSESGQRVAVITLDSRNTDATNTMFLFLNSLYTHRHGYDLLVERCSPRTDQAIINADQMDINFAKPLLLLRHLPNYDILFYVDSDAYFLEGAAPIEEVADRLLPPEAPEKILVGADCFDSSFCWSGAPNTGAILLRNNEKTFRFLEAWASSIFPGAPCSRERNVDHREQGCFNVVIASNHEAAGAGVVRVLSVEETRTGVFGTNNGTWVRHIVGHYGADRLARVQPAFVEAIRATYGLLL